MFIIRKAVDKDVELYSPIYSKRTLKIIITCLYIVLVGYSSSKGGVTYRQNIDINSDSNSTVIADTLNITRPKIGLVLSGGGAKGLAHIGVLKVLEEAGIRPDYITGTSMGSIIGALYAVGYSADDISKINSQVNWQELLSDKIPLNKIEMEAKYESERYIVKLPINNKKITLPSGLIEGQQLEALFAKLFWPLSDSEDFDKLPIPFHCMSVDIVSGETIEHSSGNIAKAIRASMSIPTIFSPEKNGTKLLVDGGITRNYPVKEVREMGADIVIGVYVGFNDSIEANQLTSLLEILSRSTALAGIINSKREFLNTDILITPDLDGLSSSDFQHSLEIEQRGYSSAKERIDDITSILDSLNIDNPSYKSTGEPIFKRRVNRFSLIDIENIEVDGDLFLSKEFIIKHSQLEIGSTVSYLDLEHAVERLYGTEYFSKVTYSLHKIEGSRYRLILDINEKPNSDFKAGLFYNNNRGISLITNLTLRNYLIPSSNTIMTISLAENSALRFSSTKFMGKKHRVMGSLFVDFNRDKLTHYKDGDDMGDYYKLFTSGGVNLRYSSGINKQIGVKGFYELNILRPRSDLRANLEEANFEEYLTHGFATSAYFSINTTDDLYFPRRGLKFYSEFKYIFKPTVKSTIESNIEERNVWIVYPDQEEATMFHSDVDLFTPISRTLTLNIGASLGMNSLESGIFNYYLLGGLHDDSRGNYQPFAGANFGEIHMCNFILTRANLNIKLLKNLYIAADSNIAVQNDIYYNLLSDLVNSEKNSYVYGYALGFKVDSGIGPIALSFGGNNINSKKRINLTVGYPF